jgi:glycosyltransferase involved in cell wall biosynthesis
VNSPLVSVVILTYNQVGFLAQTLQSTLEQDYDNLEVIVSDDASTDGTAEIIQEYALKYPGRLVPVLGESNIGVTRNSNRGLFSCKGKYIAFQGGDDIFLPGKIARQVEFMESEPGCVLCGHDVEIFDSDAGKATTLWSTTFPTRRSGRGGWVVRNGVPFAAIACMVRKDAIPPYGFDEHVPVASDWKLYIDVLANGGAWHFIDGVYARYRVSHQNISKQRKLMIRDRLVTAALVESEYPQWVDLACYPRASALYDAGIYYLKQNRRSDANRILRASLTSAIISWKQPIAILFSLLPMGWGESLLTDRVVPRTLIEFLKSLTAHE